MNIERRACVALLVIGLTSAYAQVSQAACVPAIAKAGDILVTGGEDFSESASAQSEFFDPGTGAWIATCPTSTRHDEAQIATAHGKIFVMGGETLASHSKVVEVYSPVTGKFRVGAAMNVTREDFAAVTLNSGHILAIGGFSNSENPRNTAEILTSIGWQILPKRLKVPRGAHCAAVMTGGARSGQVLIAGGTSGGESPPILKSAERFKPVSGAFVLTKGHMVVARAYADCTALPNGTVLVTGGVDDSGNALDTAEIYDPVTDSFSLTAGNMSDARVDHSATLLPDGTVLVAGGETSFTASTTKLDTADIYDPATGMFTPTALMKDRRDDNTATLISGSGTALDGQVLIEGGFFNLHAENTAEIYDPVAKTFTSTPPMNFYHGEASASVIP
jgi:Kelch motif protein/galactose oxidase-like protein